MIETALIAAAARQTLASTFGPFVDADTLGILRDRVAEVPFLGDVERYAAVIADVANAALKPFIDRATADHQANSDQARAFEAFWRMQTSPTIQ